MQEILAPLKKKDPDLSISDFNEEDDTYTINTVLDFNDINNNNEISKVDDSMLKNEMNRPSITAIHVQITLILFLTNATIAFSTLTLGMAPYSLLRLLPKQIALYVFISLISTNVLLYLLMIWLKNAPSIIIWASSLILTMGSLCAVLDDIAPLQIAAIIFAQSILVALYTIISPRHIKPWLASLLMIMVGVGVWAIGIYAFIKQADWISAGIIFGLITIFAIYSSIQILYADRYTLSYNNITQAITNFYADPLYFVLRINSVQM